MITRPETEFIEKGSGQPSAPWQRFLFSVYNACFSLYQSGTTAERPTVDLWAGRPYFDTTLGQPIWYSGTAWVDATGASV